MPSKLFGLLVVLALLLGTFGTTFAQDAMPEPFCGDLAAEDCDLLKASQAAMMDVSSYTASATYDAMLAGIPGLPAEEVNVNVAVDGAFAMGEAAVAAGKMFAGQDQQAVTEMLAEDPQPLVDLISDMDMDMVLSAEMTPELAEAFSAQAGTTVPDALSVGLKLVDGVLYADLTEIAPLAPGTPEGWVGIPLAEALQMAADQGAFAEAAAQMDASSVDPSVATSLAIQSMLMGENKMFEEFMSVERVEDDAAGNAVFESSVDISGLVSSPAFADLIKQLVASGALGADAPTETDIDQGLQMLGMFGPMLFADLYIGSTVAINPEDMLVYEYASGVSWDLAGLLQMAAMSGQLPEGLDPNAPVAVEFWTAVSNSGFNEPVTVEAPADAMMIPLEAMMSESAQ
jgi:hypothetical protein